MRSMQLVLLLRKVSYPEVVSHFSKRLFNPPRHHLEAQADQPVLPLHLTQSPSLQQTLTKSWAYQYVAEEASVIVGTLLGQYGADDKFSHG